MGLVCDVRVRIQPCTAYRPLYYYYVYQLVIYLVAMCVCLGVLVRHCQNSRWRRKPAHYVQAAIVLFAMFMAIKSIVLLSGSHNYALLELTTMAPWYFASEATLQYSWQLKGVFEEHLALSSAVSSSSSSSTTTTTTTSSSSSSFDPFIIFGVIATRTMYLVASSLFVAAGAKLQQGQDDAHERLCIVGSYLWTVICVINSLFFFNNGTSALNGLAAILTTFRDSPSVIANKKAIILRLRLATTLFSGFWLLGAFVCFLLGYFFVEINTIRAYGIAWVFWYTGLLAPGAVIASFTIGTGIRQYRPNNVSKQSAAKTLAASSASSTATSSEDIVLAKTSGNDIPASPFSLAPHEEV